MPDGAQATLILASGSPRRRALLERMHLIFQVVPADGDGPASSEDPARRVRHHAEFKARQVARSHPDSWVLAADTLVHAGDRFLPKPSHAEQAREMLEFLVHCGLHQVWTGACLIGPAGEMVSQADSAEVAFRPIPAAALEEYIQGQEWCDKAGAYAIQGWAGQYAELVHGEMDTVVGLSGNAVLDLFAVSGLPPEAFRR